MIRVANLSKIFKIPHERRDTMIQILLSFASGSYSYEEFYALKDVSFHVEQGETVGIIGRNGSGKSTLLRILAKIYQPSSGTVEINEEVFPLLELGVGFQQNFTVRDNIYLYGALLGFSRREMNTKVREILTFSELERFIDTKLDRLSTGMKARLGYAISIQGDAPIHLLDEILAVGDESFRQKCRHRFRQTRKEGKTMLFVSHDLASVLEFCDRVIILNDGQILNAGNPDTMIREYHKLFEAPAGSGAKPI